MKTIGHVILSAAAMAIILFAVALVKRQIGYSRLQMGFMSTPKVCLPQKIMDHLDRVSGVPIDKLREEADRLIAENISSGEGGSPYRTPEGGWRNLGNLSTWRRYLDNTFNILRKSKASTEVDDSVLERGSDILCLHGKMEGRDFYWFKSCSDSTILSDAYFKGRKKMELWDAATGTISRLMSSYDNGKSKVTLSFDPHDSFFVVTSPSFKKKTENLPASRIMFLDSPWEILSGDSGERMIVQSPEQVKNNSAKAKLLSEGSTLRQAFELRDDFVSNALKTELDLSVDGYLACVEINGVNLGEFWEPHIIIPVGHVLKSGTNSINIRLDRVPQNETSSFSDIQESHSGISGPILLRSSY